MDIKDIRYAGKTKNEQLQKIQEIAQNQAFELVNKFQNNLQAIIDMNKKSGFRVGMENAFGVVSVPFSVGFRIGEGLLNTFVDFVHGVYDVGHQLLYGLGKTLDEGKDGYLGFALKNVGLGMQEAFEVALNTLKYESKRLFISDDDKREALYQEQEQAQKGIMRKHDFARATFLKRAEEGQFAMWDLDDTFSDFSTDFKTPEERLDEYYSDGYRKHVQDVNDVSNYIKEKIIPVVQDIQSMGVRRPMLENLETLGWDDNEAMKQIYGTAESLGAVLGTVAMSMVMTKNNISPSMIKDFTGSYFVGRIYGKSLNEALNAGADIKDAQVYAYGMALTEGFAENLPIGFFVGGEGKSGAGKALLDIFGEGIEELSTEFLQGGYSMYISEDNKIERKSQKEFFSEGGLAFLGGVAMGGVMDFIGNATTLGGIDNRAAKLNDYLNQAISQNNSAEAIANMQSDLDNFVDRMNGEVYGTKGNKHGAGYVGEFDLADKKMFIFRNNLQNYVEYDQNSGKFVKTAFGENLSENSFKNTITEKTFDSKTNQTITQNRIIEQGEYAISDGVLGQDISDDGYFEPVKVADIEKDENKMRVYDLIKNKRQNIILIDYADDATNGFFSANGNVYLNINNVVEYSNDYILETLVRHEMVHALKYAYMGSEVDENQYLQIQKDILSMGILEIDFEETSETKVWFVPDVKHSDFGILVERAKINDKVNMTFNNEYNKKMERVNEDFKNGVISEQEFKQLRERAASDAFVKATEEFVAYTIGESLRSKAFLKAISYDVKNKGFAQKMKNAFVNNSNSALFSEEIQSKHTKKVLKQVQKLFDTEIKNMLDREKSLRAYVKKLNPLSDADNLLNTVVNKKVLDAKPEYTAEEIMNEYVRNYKGGRVVNIFGTNFYLDEVFNFGKNYDFSKHTKTMSDQEVNSSFVYDETQKKTYVKFLEKARRFYETQAENALNDEDYLEYDRKAMTLEDTIDAIRKNFALEDYELELLAEVMNEFGIKKNPEKIRVSTQDMQVIMAATKKAIRILDRDATKQSIKREYVAKNRASNTRFLGAVIDVDAKKVENNGLAIETALNVVLTDKNSQTRFNRDDYTVTNHGLSPDKRYYRFVINFSNDFIDREVAKLVAKEEAKNKPQEPVVEIDTKITNKLINTVVETFKQDIINDLKILQPELENRDYFEVVANTTVDEINALEGRNNVFVGILPINDIKKSVELLNAMAEKGSHAAVIAPIYLENSYTYQKDVKFDNLVKSGNVTMISDTDNINRTKRGAVKAIPQLWTNDTSLKSKNQRLDTHKQSSHSDLVTLIVKDKKDLARILENAKKYPNSYTMVIPMRSTNINDFELITDLSKVSTSGGYNFLFLYPQSPQAKEHLKNIDFKSLARRGTVSSYGFTLYDLVEEYKAEKRDYIMQSRRNDKQNAKETLTDEQMQVIDELFSDPILKQIFIKDYKINIDNVDFYKTNDYFEINNVKYNTNDYAIHLENYHENPSTFFIDTRTLTPVLKADILKDPLKSINYKYLQSMGLSFIIYREKGRQNTKGFSRGAKSMNVVFLNFSKMNNPKGVIETIIHEHVHEMFKFKKEVVKNFAILYKDLFFEVSKDANGKKTINKTPFFKVFSESFGLEDFYKYFSRGYRELAKTGNIKSDKGLFEFLELVEKDFDAAIRSNGNYDVLNELIAQFTGKILSNKDLHQQIFQNKDANYPANIMEEFSSLANDLSVSEFLRTHFKNFIQATEQSFNDYLAYIDQIFPSQDLIDDAEIDKLVERFTNKKYQTLEELYTKASLKDTDANKTLKQFVYLIEKLEIAVKVGSEKYAKVKEALANWEKRLDIIFEKRDSIMKIVADNGNVFQDYRRFERSLATVYNKIIKDKSDTERFDIEDKENQKRVIEQLQDAREKLADLNDSYGFIEDDVLDIFGLINSQDFTDAVGDMVSALDYVLDFFLDPLYKWKNFGKLINELRDNDLRTFKLLLKGRFSQDVAMKQPLYRVAQLIVKERTTNVKNFVNEIERGINSVLKKYYENKKSPMYDALVTLTDLYRDFLKAFHKPENINDFSSLADEILDVGGKISDFILEGSKKILRHEISDERRLELHEMMFEVYANVAALTGEIKLITETFADNEFVELGLFEPLLENYSGSKIVSIFRKIFNAFEYVPKSAIDGYNLSHDEYAIKNADEINEFAEKKDKPTFKGLGMLSPFVTPQSILQTLARDLSDISFFRDLEKQYITVTTKSEDVKVKSHNAFKNFLKKNPNAINYVVKEKRNVSGLLSMPSNEMDDIFHEVETEMTKRRDAIKVKQEKVEEWKKEVTLKKFELRKQNELHKTETDETEKAKIKKVITGLESDIKKLNKNMKAFRSSIREDKLQVSKVAKNALLTETFHKYRRNTHIGKGYEVSIGELITLYLSLKREIALNTQDNDLGSPATNHFHYLNKMFIVDSELESKKGFSKARSETTSVYMVVERERLFENVKSIIESDETAMAIIQFAETMFEYGYNVINEYYRLREGVDLPKSMYYIPFQMMSAEFLRNIEQKGKDNIGVFSGMTMRTTMGAKTPPVIQNIITLLERYLFQTVANYPYNNLIKSVQNLFVNRAGGATFIDNVQGKNSKIGYNLPIEEFLNTTFARILGYYDKSSSFIADLFNKAISLEITAVVAGNIGMVLKQPISLVTIAIHHKLNIMNLIKNFVEATVRSPRAKAAHDFLMRYVPNFALRAEHIIPLLVKHFEEGTLSKANSAKRKVVELLSLPAGKVDNDVIVAGLLSLVDELAKKHPELDMKKDEDLHELFWKAKPRIEEILLHSVANTTNAYRSHFSTNKDPFVRMFSKFQSEIIMQVSKLLNMFYGWMNGTLPLSQLIRAILAFLASGLVSAIVSSTVNEVRGYNDDSNRLADLLLDEFLLGNVIGGVPIFNALTSLIRLEISKDGKVSITEGFEPQVPVVSLMYNIIKQASNLNGTKKDVLTYYKIAEHLGTMTGVPLRNIKNIVLSTSRMIDTKSAANVEGFFRNRNEQQKFDNAVKSGKVNTVQKYVDSQIDDYGVKTEIYRLLLANPDKKLNFYLGVKTFNATDADGNKVTYDIPRQTQDKYNKIANNALRKVVRKGAYRRLTDEQKIKVLQRIINYYNNYMRLDIRTKKKKDLKALLSIDAVIENALKNVK